MIPETPSPIIEHRLRVARAERLGPHLAELALQRRRDRGLAVRALRRHPATALVAVGTRLQAAVPARRSAAAVNAARPTAEGGEAGRG
jgi:hypothetical protein